MSADRRLELRGTLRNEANLWGKWLSWHGRWRFGSRRVRGGLEVLKGPESTEEHAVCRIDAPLNAGEGI
jgi:hypothetical protein